MYSREVFQTQTAEAQYADGQAGPGPAVGGGGT